MKWRLAYQAALVAAALGICGDIARAGSIAVVTDVVNEVYRRYFPKGLPARSHVGVSRLVGSGLKIEIEMVAVVPDD